VKQVIIEDMTGKRIKNIYVNWSVNNPASVDVSDLASGTYRVLIVATDKSIAHQPLIIAR
jgi:hypothetical protein